MALTIEETRERVIVTLPGDLDLASARPLSDALQQALQSGRPVLINAAAVDRVNTAAVQVLLAGSQAFGADRFQLTGASEELVEACRVLGLEDWLSGWSGS